MTEKTEKEMIRDLHDDVIEIKTVLLGVPNTADKGLVGLVNKLFNGHIRLKVTVYSLIALLSGLGVIDATVFHRVIGG